MEFIYCGKVDVNENHMDEFKKLLETLKIDTKINEMKEEAFNDDDEMFEEIKVKEEKGDFSEIIQMTEMHEEGQVEGGNYEYSSDEPASSSFLQQQRQQTPKIIKVVSHAPRKRTKVDSVVKSEIARRFMDENPTDCPFCKKSSSSNKNRNEHVKYCTLNPDRVVSYCPYCDKSFCDPYYVRKHIKTLHSDKKHLSPQLSISFG